MSKEQIKQKEKLNEYRLTKPRSATAVVAMSNIDQKAANEYRSLLLDINNNQSLKRILKITREFIQKHPNFSEQHQNMLLDPIFKAIDKQEEGIAPSPYEVEVIDNKGGLEDWNPKRSAEATLLKEEILADFRKENVFVNSKKRKIISKNPEEYTPLMKAVYENDAEKVRDFLKKNYPIDEDVIEHYNENYPLMLIPSRLQYRTEKEILADLKVAFTADDILNADNTEQAIRNQQMHITDSNIDLLSTRISNACNDNNHFIEKISEINVNGNLKKIIDKIKDKVLPSSKSILQSSQNTKKNENIDIQQESFQNVYPSSQDTPLTTQKPFEEIILRNISAIDSLSRVKTSSIAQSFIGNNKVHNLLMMNENHIMDEKFDINQFAQQIASDKNALNKLSNTRFSGRMADKLDRIAVEVKNIQDRQLDNFSSSSPKSISRNRL